MLNEIINIIERNRISSTEVADALEKKGVVPGLVSLNQGKHICGKIKYCFAYNDSNWSIHEQIIDLEENCVVFIDVFNCDNRAIIGDLMSKYILLYRRAKAIIINGLIRDVPNVKKNGYPVWAKGVTPLGCFNRKVEITPDLQKQIDERRKYFEGGIITCDDSGCTVIEARLINAETYKKMDLIELQEDIWYYCLDTLKWNTYDIVCLKKYLSEGDVLPKVLKDRLDEISFNA